MKLNPDNDTLSSVGDDLGGGCVGDGYGEGYGKYSGTVVGKDYCLYGIPDDNTHIIKFDPTNPDTTSTVGEEAEFALTTTATTFRIKSASLVVIECEATATDYFNKFNII
jgi:hypothetical protein